MLKFVKNEKVNCGKKFLAISRIYQSFYCYFGQNKNSFENYYIYLFYILVII